VSFLAELTFL